MDNMLTLPAKLESLGQFMTYVRQFAGQKNMDEANVKRLELALEEALVNIINYAYPDADGEIGVACEFAGEADIIVRICDRGQAFDMSAKEDPDTESPLEDRPVGGLGIFLIRQMVNEVNYTREDGKNILVLRMKTGGPMC